MKNKFYKNDKLLLHAFIIVDVVAIAYLAIGIILGIVNIVIGAISGTVDTIIFGVVLIIAIPIFDFIIWVLLKVTLNLFCDVKLIRNNLYNIDNTYLENIIEDKKNQTFANTQGNQDLSLGNVSYEDDKNNSHSIFSNAQKLKQLKSLLDDGILTQAEFDVEKQKLLNESISQT